MTKYKKLTKSAFAIVALSLILVAVLAFGGTYAYFSAKDTVSGTATLGTLAVKLNVDSTSLTLETNEVVPNQEIFAGNTIAVTYPDTNINFYARVKITAVFENAASITPGTGEPATNEVLTIGGMSGWVKSGDYYYLATSETAATKATATSAPATIAPTVTIAKEVGANGSKAYMGETITVTVVMEVLQAVYLASSTEAGDALSVTALAGAWDGYVQTAKSQS